MYAMYAEAGESENDECDRSALGVARSDEPGAQRS
jgi:hypothetical protein